ncbi:osmotically-inducible protein OsmY [Streptosporangium becharense]|uniref:Osmotically-inducible protein OsmY n=1 Tax=Streptosporangium becharense TaxID=1816182 RepID=A0A7W9IIZ9_9ACTN|nr:BON domain-containing protein [Streptosporangium becharense]MBB2911328.1 osmotically-inducible protein OsmY [Streptosporangium becharense]MBB5821614.1 osmotically-inducible protein OsmY [Streptosporangium becharense]
MEAPQYIAARVQRALAEDDRTTELGIRVDVRGDQLYLRGQVNCAERCRLITEVAREAAPGLVIHNEIDVVDVREPVGEEKL